MKKHYVLEENEYLELCNGLEKISYKLTQLHAQLSDEDKSNLKEHFIGIDKKLTELMKEMDWA